MRVAIGSDHAGFELKERLKSEMAALGIAVEDLGTSSAEVSVDYPDFSIAVGEAVASGRAERGVVVCATGIGASIAANKVDGVRAAVCHDTYSAHQGVEHDDMNVLTLGARVIGAEPALECALAFLGATFSGEPRHRRRLDKVLAIERATIEDSAPKGASA